MLSFVEHLKAEFKNIKMGLFIKGSRDGEHYSLRGAGMAQW